MTIINNDNDIKAGSKLNKTEKTVYKYFNDERNELWESVTIKGIPYFIKYNPEKYTKGVLAFDMVDKLDEEIRILKPPHVEDCPFEPYKFRDVMEIHEYIKRAHQETIDSLYDKNRLYAKKFNEMDKNTIELLTTTIINSYFQDRFSTVYYLEIVGANGTGKSAFGDTFESLGYRVIKINNATEAFWIRIFGTVQSGQVTVIAEEVDKMDENSNVMSMLKEGYRQNSKVPRMNNDNSKMDFYFPFCFKIMIGETSPSELKARGILDRTFLQKSYKGYPMENIKELKKLRLSPRMKSLLDELRDLRKLLLVYKLIHFNDPMSEVDVNLDGRDEELCKPSLELFFNLGASETRMKELEATFQHFIDVKNKRKKQGLEAVLHPVIGGHISKDNNRLSTSSLWDIITADGIGIKGNLDQVNGNVFYSAKYGKLYRNRTTKMVCDQFGAETEHTRDGDIFVFDYEHFERIGKIYNNSGKIKTKLVDCDTCDPCEHGAGRPTPPSTTTTVTPKTSVPTLGDLFYNPDLGKSTSDQEKEWTLPPGCSRVSHVSQASESVNQIANKKVKCPNCEYETEPFYMKIHQCTNPKQLQKST